MKTLKFITTKILLFTLLITFVSCGEPDFEGVWTCEKNKGFTFIITKISNETYKIKLNENSSSSFSGKVEDGVLVANSMGSTERFSVKNNKLHWSSMFADECSVFVKD